MNNEETGRLKRIVHICFLAEAQSFQSEKKHVNPEKWGFLYLFIEVK